MGDILNDTGVERACEIARCIIAHSYNVKRLDYTARMTTPPGKQVLAADLRLERFSVGTVDDLTELPFADMLAVFCVVDQWNQAALLAHSQGKQIPPGVTFKFTVPRSFSDEEEQRLLSLFSLETLDGKRFRLRLPPNDDG